MGLFPISKGTRWHHGFRFLTFLLYTDWILLDINGAFVDFGKFNSIHKHLVLQVASHMCLLWDKYCKLGNLWKTFYLILVLLLRCRLLLLVSWKSQTKSQFLTNQWRQKTLICLVTQALVFIVFLFWVGTKATTATRVRQMLMFSFNMKPCHTFWINLYFSKSHSWKQRLWKTGDGTAMGQRESS